MTYKLYIRMSHTQADAAIKTNEDGSVTSFLFVEQSADYQAYLKWLEAGNQPLPADEETQ